MKQILNFIDGRLIPAQSGQWIENPEPATGRPYSLIADSDESDMVAAVDAAQRAFPSWAGKSSQERSQVLRKLARLIEAQAEEFAEAESIDTGKPLSLARKVDIPRSIANFDFFADAITQFETQCHPMGNAALNYTLRSPLGVVACISPWNLPLYLLSWKIAPALAMGNTVVAKPSEVTPMTAFLLSQVCEKAGIPHGVLNIVNGLGHKVGSPLVSNARVRAVSFTGSTRTGSEIAVASARAFKKVSLEMGGKNPNVIFADADLDQALSETVRAAFSNQGQICLCGSRIYVQKAIYESFKNRLVEKVRTLKLGDPLLEGTEQGALVSKVHFEKVMAAIEMAKKEGGKVLAGGNRAVMSGRCERGWFVEPTLIEGLSISAHTEQEEIFGPVATLSPFESESEVVEWCNGTRYGLSASIWTRDLSRAHRMSALIEAGIVWINCWMLRDLRTAFGGVKDSGVGREGGQEALRFFSEPKNVCVQL